jgi:GNAT superfamily N-acetyltransferase
MHRIRLAVRENRLANRELVQPDDYVPLLTTDGRGWVAELEGRMAGFAIADRSRSNVWALFVNPDLEGRGAGRALHDTMMNWMFGEGLERVWLGTQPGTRAERFYRTAGWRRTGRETGEARYELTTHEWPTGKES